MTTSPLLGLLHLSVKRDFIYVNIYLLSLLILKKSFAHFQIIECPGGEGGIKRLAACQDTETTFFRHHLLPKKHNKTYKHTNHKTAKLI